MELKTKTQQNVPPRGVSLTTPPRGPTPTPRSPWARSAVRELAYRAGPTGTLPHSDKRQRGTAEKRFSARKIVHVQKRSERAHFLVRPARTNLEGGGSGRGANVYVHWRFRGRTPPCASYVSFLLVFGALGRKTQRTQIGALCAVAMEKVVSLGVGRASPFFCDFPDAHFAVYGARQALRSKTWVPATLHRQGPRMVFEARNVWFDITGARNRPIPTLLPSETCAQTPLDQPRMLFRRDPDFADAPETA